MSHKFPLGKIKDVTVETLKVPASVAGSVAGSAVGLARTATGKATERVTSLVGGRGQRQHAGAPASEPKVEIKPDEPVNVTEELGLDPAPVERPTKPKAAPAKPVTAIDAQADPDDVHVTPADVADVVKKDPADG